MTNHQKGIGFSLGRQVRVGRVCGGAPELSRF